MTIDSPAAILYDNQGNPVGVVLEGVVYKLQAQVTGAAPSGSPAIGNPVLVGGSDGVNIQVPKVFDLDTGSDLDYNLGISLRLPGSGGSVVGGTSSDPIRIDPTGTTIQPVSGTITANIGTTNGLTLDSTLTNGSQTTKITDGINTATVKAASTPATTTDTAIVVTISPNNTVISNTDGYVTIVAPSYIDSTFQSLSLTTAGALRVDGSAVTQPISAATLPLPTGAATEATLATRLDDATFTARINTLGQKTMANSTPVVIASDQSTISISGTITSNIGTTGGLALDATLAKLTIPQGDSLGSNTQVLVGASVSISSPSYTDGYINPLSLTMAGALRVDGSAVTQPISGTITVNQGTNPWTTDVTDRATRLLGVIYGSQGQQIKQTATDFNTQVEIAVGGTLIDPRQIRVLTSADVVTANAGSGTFNIAGTVTANVGTTGGLALDSTLAKLTITQSTALGSNTQALVGGSVTTAAPTYADGNINPLSLTTTGALRVDSSGITQPISGTVTANQGTSPWVTNVSQFGGNSVVTGTGTSGVGIPRVTVSNDSNILATQSGTWTVQPGNTANTTPWLTTINQGGNSATVTASNALKVDGSAVTQPVSGTITANIGTTNGLALDTTLAKLTISQGTALGSNTQALMGGSVTTAAPAYTNGNINPLSLTTSGLLRVDGSGVTQPISGTVTANIGTTNGLALDATLTGGTQTTRITDGTNTATVKAASTAAVATDKALVVTISPNNSVAVTQATASNLNAQVQGAGANGAAVTGNPVLIAGSDGANARTIKTLTDGTQVFRYKEIATFTGMATDIAVANNKSMFSIVNASGSTVTARISAIYVTSVQTTNVTGVIGTFELRRITNHSAGTAITAIETMNTTDSLNSSITVRTNGTVTSESTNLLWRTMFSTDEWVVSANIDTAATGHFFSTMFPIFKRADFDDKPIILNANEGITIKFATNSTVGTFDIMVVFTQE